jgi:Lytic transglycolase
VRHPRVVASLALIAILATVAVPGPVGSRAPSPVSSTRLGPFTAVEVDASVRGPAVTIQPLDPGARSAATLDPRSTLIEPAQRSEPPQARPDAAQPQPQRGSVTRNPWRTDPEISWYGPGLIGNGTACGQNLTRSLVGVAHRSLPCGTKITFRHAGTILTMPVVDRGPYVSGRIFDLTYGACKALGHCFTGPIQWRYGPSS